MPTIEYKQGDLTKAPETLIVHGCNAQGVMGSGVAKAIRAKWPEAYQTYKMFCDAQTDKGNLLGKIIPVVVSNRTIVINAITQLDFGKDGKQYVDYQAVSDCMNSISDNYRGRVAMPKIGSGLGGGDWSIIKAIIERTLVETNDVVVYEL